MYKSKIIAYMESTAPETALSANSEYGIKAIRKEAKEELAALLSAKETAEQLGMTDTARKILDDAVFAARWLAKFGVSDI